MCRGSSLSSPPGEAQNGKGQGAVGIAAVARTEERSGERVLRVLRERTRTGMESLEERKVSHLSDILPEGFLGTMMGFEFALAGAVNGRQLERELAVPGSPPTPGGASRDSLLARRSGRGKSEKVGDGRRSECPPASRNAFYTTEFY